MSNLSQDDSGGKITDRPYRTITRAVAYARPGRAAMIQLEQGETILGRLADVDGWIAWIDEGEVIGYIRLDELEP